MNVNPLFPYPNIHTHKARNSLQVQNLFPEDTPPQQGVFSVGIHPCYIVGDGTEQWEKVLEHATHPLCVAIGECGLDKRASAPLSLQEKVFRWHISLAQQLHKPLIIHCVRSYGEIIRLRKETGATGMWILHGFRKSEALAHQLLGVGIKLSFGTALLHDTRLQHLAKILPREDYFLETDEDPTPIEEVLTFLHSKS